MVNSFDLETKHIPHLRTQMANGSLVLFTGAGFSLEAVNRQSETLPSVLKLTKLLWNICYPNAEFEQDTELQDIYETANNLHRNNLSKLLISELSVDQEKFPDWYATLLSMPWLRCYTLNIDDLIEQVALKVGFQREVRSVSATSDNIAQLSSGCLDVIHLNGSMKDVPTGITFSRTQYAERVGNDPFYRQLNADLLTRPIIFIGSKLEEGSLWGHLVARGDKGSRAASELRPRSYLVIPHLNRSKISMLAKFNIIWLSMTGQEFCEKVVSRLNNVCSNGFRALKNRGLASDTRNVKLRLVSDIAQSYTPSSEFLMGQEPVWADFQNGKVAERECFDNLFLKAKEILSNTAKRQFLIITGTAGTGKSTGLMWLALKLQAKGIVSTWMDAEIKLTRREFSKAIENLSDAGALLINDADIYRGAMSSMVYEVLEKYPKIIIVIESRSTKLDSVIKQFELRDIIGIEFTMPYLCDSDISRLIKVLDTENRLGTLKGKSDLERVNAFSNVAGRQLLVAMYEATSGQRFSERAVDELKDLSSESRLVYALVSSASAYRYALTRDELVIACGTSNNETLNNIEVLSRRKLINQTQAGAGFLKARHRVIANLVYQELVKSGMFEGVLRGLLMIGVAKVSEGSDRNSRPSRLLRTFVNHNFMKHAVSVDVARNIYGEFEEPLSWDSHYWLHRGALELESDQLSMAENFLGQAMSIRSDDIFIQTEWAYLLFKKAIYNPTDPDSENNIQDAIRILQSIIVRRKDQSAHAYHILGQQSLAWFQAGIFDKASKEILLRNLESQIETGIMLHPRDEYLPNLKNDIRRVSLLLATTE